MCDKAMPPQGEAVAAAAGVAPANDAALAGAAAGADADAPAGAADTAADAAAPAPGNGGDVAADARSSCCCWARAAPANGGAVPAADADQGVLPPGAHPRDIFMGLSMVTFAILWAFLVSMTNSEVLYQFPLLALVAVLATGGLEEENNLHNLLASAWWEAGVNRPILPDNPTTCRKFTQLFREFWVSIQTSWRLDGDPQDPVAADWCGWTQIWNVTEARQYIKQQGGGRWLLAFSVCRWIGMTIGLLGFFFLPFLLGGITSFRSTSTETETGISDLAPLGNGLLALCGAGNCSGLSPSTVDAFEISGQWTRQFLWCEDTASIECEEPVRRLEDEGGEESVISFVLEVERNESTETDRLRSLSLQIFDSNGTEEVGIIANTTIDGLWWTMNDVSSYVKIRWAPNDGTYFNESWHNEDVFVFSGLTSVETVPSSTTPVCFSEETTRKYEALPENERTGVIDHILSETATREILRSSYLNIFFTNGITGNPYRSVHTVGEPSLLLEEAVQAMADDDSPFVSLQCAEGTLDDGAPEVTLANFLASPGLQADRVHVVGAGEFFWETEEEIATEFFTDQEWEGEDVFTVVVLGLGLVFVLSGVIYEECRRDVKNTRTPGLFTMAGSLVGRIALVLIMAEGSIFLADSSRGGELTEDGADAAIKAALVYKYVSWVLLLTVILGDGVFAPWCWFTTPVRQ